MSIAPQTSMPSVTPRARLLAGAILFVVAFVVAFVVTNGFATRIALGVPIPVPIALRQPLGDRTVLDESGRPVPDLGQYRTPGAPNQ